MESKSWQAGRVQVKGSNNSKQASGKGFRASRIYASPGSPTPSPVSEAEDCALAHSRQPDLKKLLEGPIKLAFCRLKARLCRTT